MKMLQNARRRLARSLPVRRQYPLRGTSRKENFWFIGAARSEDETEIRTGRAPAEQLLKDIRRQTRWHYQVFDRRSVRPRTD